MSNRFPEKETVIVVTGANYLESHASFLQKIILWFYRVFHIVPRYEYVREQWLHDLECPDRDLIYFSWSGRFWPWSVREASNKLQSLIRDKNTVKIIVCSLGAQVVVNILNKSKNIEKVISLAGVYRRTNSLTPFIDIRSPMDIFGNGFFTLFNLFAFHTMKIQKVILPGLRHDDFHENNVITRGKFTKRRLSDVINIFLE